MGGSWCEASPPLQNLSVMVIIRSGCDRKCLMLMIPPSVSPIYRDIPGCRYGVAGRHRGGRGDVGIGGRKEFGGE